MYVSHSRAYHDSIGYEWYLLYACLKGTSVQQSCQLAKGIIDYVPCYLLKKFQTIYIPKAKCCPEMQRL